MTVVRGASVRSRQRNLPAGREIAFTGPKIAVAPRPTDGGALPAGIWVVMKELNPPLTALLTHRALPACNLSHMH